MIEFYNYKDEEISIMLPSNLKSKNGVRYFTADRRRVRFPDIQSLSIDMHDEENAVDLMNILSRTIVSNWEDTRQKYIHMGEVFLNGSGYETLVETYNQYTKVLSVRYDRVVCLQPKTKYAYMIFQKIGPIDGFYDLCCEIVKSARIPKVE